jgi:RecA-family ATPase
VVEALKPKLVILDPVGDLFGGDENRRADVRQFVAWHNGLAMNGDLAVSQGAPFHREFDSSLFH